VTALLYIKNKLDETLSKYGITSSES